MGRPAMHARSHSSDSAISDQAADDLRLPFLLDSSSSVPLGRVHPLVLEAMREDNARMIAMHCAPAWLIDEDGCSFSDNVASFDERSEQVDRFIRILKESGRFSHLLDDWTERPAQVIAQIRVGDQINGFDMKDAVWSMESAACPLFGIEETA